MDHQSQNPWPDRFSERLHIVAHGEGFDVDAFLATSTIRPDYVWRKGPRETSGIEIFLGDGRVLAPTDQEEIAITYLEAHKNELRALANTPGVETFNIGLVSICQPEHTGASVGPSPQLMVHALEVGVWPRFYVALDTRESDKDQIEETYFLYSSAALRIWGQISNMDEISATLGLSPTSSHRHAEKRTPKAVPYREDMWSYQASVDKSQPLVEHIDALWLKLRPHKQYLLEVKKSMKVDAFLGYVSNSGTAGIEVPHTSLEMFTELGIPFRVSIIVA